MSLRQNRPAAFAIPVSSGTELRHFPETAPAAALEGISSESRALGVRRLRAWLFESAKEPRMVMYLEAEDPEQALQAMVEQRSGLGYYIGAFQEATSPLDPVRELSRVQAVSEWTVPQWDGQPFEDAGLAIQILPENVDEFIRINRAIFGNPAFESSRQNIGFLCFRVWLQPTDPPLAIAYLAAQDIEASLSASLSAESPIDMWLRSKTHALATPGEDPYLGLSVSPIFRWDA